MTPAQNTVAYIQGFEDGKRSAKAEFAKLLERPQRKPLTEAKIEEVWRKVQANDFHDCVQPFARAIEAAHGIEEKNA